MPSRFPTRPAAPHLAQLLRGLHSQGQLAAANRGWLASLMAVVAQQLLAPAGGAVRQGGAALSQAAAAASSGALFRLDQQGREVLAILRQLPLLPLSGGAWAAPASSQHIYFPAEGLWWLGLAGLLVNSWCALGNG